MNVTTQVQAATHADRPPGVSAGGSPELAAAPQAPERFRLSRAGIFNVWQYDEQVFEFAGGRLLLRGTNGAGKSKTLEMLLPFVLDGDAGSMDATGKRGSGLIWLMSEGITTGASSRLGYLWVEFARTDTAGVKHTLTCGVGLRLGASAKQVAKWYFTTTRRVDAADLCLTTETGPLTFRALEEEIGESGRVFQRPGEFRAHVGKVLFGLQPDRYDELLRLLYWLRRPQVGEDIDPKKIAEMLGYALPALPDQAVKQVGATFDELTAFGERIARRQDSLIALGLLTGTYRRYARGVTALRSRALVESANGQAAAARAHTQHITQFQVLTDRLAAERLDHATAGQLQETAAATLLELERSPGADRRRELELQQAAARRLALQARELAARTVADQGRSIQSRKLADDASSRLAREQSGVVQQVRELAIAGADLRVSTPVVPQDTVWDVDAAMGAELDEAALGELAEQNLIPWERVVPAAAETSLQLAGVLALLDDLARALVELERRSARVVADERELASADGKAEQAEGRLADANIKVAAAEDGYRRELTGWQVDDRRGEVQVDDLLAGDRDGDAIATLPTRARERAAPTERALADQRAERQNAAVSARAEQAERTAERAAVAARTDPEPPAPHWDRDAREPTIGLPLWRLVDVQPQVDEAHRAGLEAGLQAAGLLDALVLADGTALHSGTRDVVLAPGHPTAGPSLTALLRPSIPDGSPVDAATVTRLLASIAVQSPASGGPTGATTPIAGPQGAEAAFGVDGRFKLGPLSGRSIKPAAQYLGATARAAERLRLLAVLDEQIAHSVLIAEQAETQAELLRRRLDDLRNWLGQAPTGRAVLDAWQARDLREEQRDEARAAADAAARRAEQSRAAHAESRTRTQELANRADVAPKGDLVAARRRDADEARRLAAGIPTSVTRLRAETRSWVGAIARAVADRWSATESAEKAEAARNEADLAQTQYQAAMTAADPELKDLAERIGKARTDEREAKAAATRLQTAIEQTARDQGRAEEAVAGSAEAAAAAEQAFASAERDLRFLALIPGLVSAAFDDEAAILGPAAERSEVNATDQDQDGDQDVAAGERPITDRGAAADDEPSTDRGAVADAERSTDRGAVGILAATPQGPALVRLARRWVRELGDQPELSVNVLHKAAQEANTTAAADNDPRITEEGGLWSAQAEHNGVTGPITEIVRMLDAAVTEDRELLTDRERRLFEEHLLGDLGEALRARLQEAEELVAATNRILATVSTSQGIRVRLDWAVRDDAGIGAAEAVRLLRRMSQLSSAERERLRELMHDIIENAKADAPELSYTEHLGTALDYRSWHGFTVRINRPEWAGAWRPLTRTTGLSQGEQKVVCYLPLFAAAAAHFTAVAGAHAPYAPRFILLDDAFPKIDVHTHPLLFGLLVDLDLDFVITSERLWGDTPRLPSLAIYETLRAPGEIGIAQYEYRWDGRRRTTVDR